MKKSDSTKMFNNPFLSLKHADFRYYWIGMCISTTGTWMQNIAQPWLAYQITGSAFLLSLVSTLQFTPVLLFSLFAGVVIDRFPKKNILIFTQSASLCITLVLSILAFTGKVQYWHLLVLSTLLGFVNTLDMPTRQSFVVELVGKEDLTNAIALNSTMFNIARILGPAAAGLVMGYFGIAVCFLANAVSYAAVLISLFFIHPTPLPKPPRKETGILLSIKEGLLYIFRKKSLYVTILILAVVGTFAPNFNVLVPVYAKTILGQNEAGFGLLMSFMGVGSFFGAMLVATMSRTGPKKIILYLVPIVVGTFLILDGTISNYFLMAFMLAVTGFFFVLFSSSTNSAIQISASPEYHGRVMSVYSLVFAGSTPIGNLYAGFFAQHFNARIGFMACGAIILVLMVPIYSYIADKRRTGLL